MNAIKHLGLYFGEQELTLFLKELSIKDSPKLKRGDSTTHLSNEKLGIELTFKDEKSLDVKSRDYAEGALVLSNIRFYGVATETYQEWKGELPFSLAFGETKAKLIEIFGTPTRDNLVLNQIRWDQTGYVIFAKLNKDMRLEIFGLQLPIV